MKIILEPQQKCKSLIFNTLQRLVEMINLTNIHSYAKYGKSEGILGHDFSNWKSKKQEYIITACIDIQIEIVPVPFEKISERQPAEPSSEIRKRVIKARAIQEERFAAYEGIHCNAQMTSKLLHQFAVPDAAGLAILKRAMLRLNLSARAYDRILKVSRTIADLEACENVEVRHLAEAIQYRSLDRENWGM